MTSPTRPAYIIMPEELHTELKSWCASHGVTMTAYVVDAVERSLRWDRNLEASTRTK
ncbi:hypothetical protein Uis1B_2272 [Bifidobacterium margollesii]|uniref:CopG-like ribbon-helix-helix domain-containing protein n=1 Tax=Bifidobacterium margollesii TaxID=2020964 RepID=A0A2N5J6Q1_9BIFI|nr:hypothetical protein [Bifidobacterium margollesii]PLS29891.1 hypothetical protein Uis1B_2272 [Bifidobacterium margollesii]